MPTDKSPHEGDETLALPDTDTAQTADETAVLPVAEEQSTPALADTTRPLPVAGAAPSDGGTEAGADTSAYTSPLGVFYTPADRPAPVDAEPATVEPDPVVPPRHRLRVATVVWGLVIAAIGVGLLAWAAGFEIDVQLAMIVLLAVAGTVLLVGSIVSGARNARR